MNAIDLDRELRELLEVADFEDAGVNGLQVANTRAVSRVGTAVTLTSRVIRRALDLGADTILVHHGVLWHSVTEPIVGVHRERLELLLRHDMALLAYHLPLDAHKTVGNSVRLLNQLYEPHQRGPAPRRILVDQPWVWRRDLGEPLRWSAGHAGPYRVRSWTSAAKNLATGGPCTSVTVATGKGDRSITADVGLGGDLFVTGEVSLQTFEAAADQGRAILCVGHHDSEMDGLRALGVWIERHLALDVVEVPEPCPI